MTWPGLAGRLIAAASLPAMAQWIAAVLFQEVLSIASRRVAKVAGKANDDRAATGDPPDAPFSTPGRPGCRQGWSGAGTHFRFTGEGAAGAEVTSQ
jgi:hypothetical protein